MSSTQTKEGMEAISNPERGHHIINNNVLKFHRDVISTFVSEVLKDDLERMINLGKLSTSSSVYKAMNEPVTDDAKGWIRDELKLIYVRRDGDENATVYGTQIQPMRKIIFDYMKSANDDMNSSKPYVCDSTFTENVVRNITHATNAFLMGEYFIDKPTLDMWKKEKTTKPKDVLKFDKANKEVHEMFKKLNAGVRDDTLIQWIKELRKASGR